MASIGESWAEILLKYKVSDLLDEDVFVLKQVPPTATIPEVLEVLSENKIQSVPVYDESKQSYLGLIDMLDIATVAVTLGESKGLVDLAAHHTVPLSQFFERAEFVFSVQEIGALCNASERNEWRPVRSDAPLTDAFGLLGHPCHLHRIPVVDAENFMRGFLTQSEVISWLASLLPLLRASVLSRKLSDISIGSSEVISTTEDAIALSAFQKMLENNLRALAVVDSAGKLTGCISASDLKRSTPHTLFYDLNKTVAEYLKLTSADVAIPSSSSTISADATVGELLGQLKNTHYHRLFITSPSGEPTKVISLTDILSWFSLNYIHE